MRGSHIPRTLVIAARPMFGASNGTLAAEVSKAGGLGEAGVALGLRDSRFFLSPPDCFRLFCFGADPSEPAGLTFSKVSFLAAGSSRRDHLLSAVGPRRADLSIAPKVLDSKIPS